MRVLNEITHIRCWTECLLTINAPSIQGIGDHTDILFITSVFSILLLQCLNPAPTASSTGTSCDVCSVYVCWIELSSSLPLVLIQMQCSNCKATEFAFDKPVMFLDFWRLCLSQLIKNLSFHFILEMTGFHNLTHSRTPWNIRSSFPNLEQGHWWFLSRLTFTCY